MLKNVRFQEISALLGNVEYQLCYKIFDLISKTGLKCVFFGPIEGHVIVGFIEMLKLQM